jgi:hypothetical protein
MVHLHHFSKQNSRNQGFSYYFCLMIEGSVAGSIPLTNGSVSVSRTRRPKNVRIRRIRIRNTGYNRTRFLLWEQCLKNHKPRRSCSCSGTASVVLRSGILPPALAIWQQDKRCKCSIMFWKSRSRVELRSVVLPIFYLKNQCQYGI